MLFKPTPKALPRRFAPPTRPFAIASKRRAAKVASEKEAELIAHANTGKLLARLGLGSSSEVSKGSRRSDVLVDRAALAILNKKLAKGGHFGLTGKPARVVRRRPGSELKKIKRWGAEYTLTRKARHILTQVSAPVGTGIALQVHVPHWDHASEVWKTLAYVAAIPVGERLAFTLKLAPEIAMRAIAAPKGPSKYLQDRLATKLREAFPEGDAPAFMIVLETTGEPRLSSSTNGLHIHGTIERPRSGAVCHLKDALCDAAGKISGAGRARQLHLVSSLNPVGWTAYLLKNALSTEMALKEARTISACSFVPASQSTLAASARLRRQAKRWFNSRRDDEDLVWVSRRKALARTLL